MREIAGAFTYGETTSTERGDEMPALPGGCRIDMVSVFPAKSLPNGMPVLWCSIEGDVAAQLLVLHTTARDRISFIFHSHRGSVRRITSRDHRWGACQT